jgi:hypothetical protein
MLPSTATPQLFYANDEAGKQGEDRFQSSQEIRRARSPYQRLMAYCFSEQHENLQQKVTLAN